MKTFGNYKIKDLIDVQKYLSSIPDINSGGCGISALAMYRWMKKKGLVNHKTRFVFLYKYYSQRIYLNNKNVLTQKKGKPVAPNHIALIHNGKIIDSNGICDLGEFEWIQNVTEEEFVVKTNNQVGTWNNSFDRSYVKTIEKKLGIELSDIISDKARLNIMMED